MEKLLIQKKLENIDVDLGNLVLGDFDKIGMFTAYKTREPNDPLYKSVGCGFRPNLERGILLYSLIRRYNLTSVLEIGFGRGYSTFCCAKAFTDMGVQGRITTIDPALDQKFLEQLNAVFPKQWFDMINFNKGTSQLAFDNIEKANIEPADIVIIDGDHSYEGVKYDITNASKLCKSFMICDDYHLPSKNDPGIECARAIDEFDHEAAGFSNKELIITDRRIFFDDRRIPDDEIDYGQVLFTKNNVEDEEW